MLTRTLAASAAVACATSAQAGLISQTLNFGPSTPNYNSVLTFNKYAGLAGDIISIQVFLELDINGGRLELDNDGIGPASGTAKLGATASISSGDVPLLNVMFQPVTGAAEASNSTVFNLAANDGDDPSSFQVGGADYLLFLGTPASDSKSGFINPALHFAYAGGGTFDITAAVSQIFDYGAIGGISFSGTPVTASGSVTIIYDIIPAPGAITLLGIAGVASRRRRRMN